MSEQYTKAKEVAARLGYTKLTELQEKAFSFEEALSDAPSWVLIVGNTSSGKTLIPLMKFFLERMDGKQTHMLFAVPYRALAAQKYKEISEMAQALGLELNIQVSTGELRAGDPEVRSGAADIAVIIYEKIFMFASMDDRFLEQYEFLVMDEIGLTQDVVRGIKADFILARAKMYPRMSVMGLATPYYDWSAYQENFGFSCVREERRPVKLLTYPIYVNRKKPRFVDHVEEGCQAVSEGPLLTYTNRPDDPNPRQWWDELVEDICSWHLPQEHRILIFINNREEVHQLSRRLFATLMARGLLKPWISEEECRGYLAERMKMAEEDLEGELYGVFEEEDYRAFSCGISYHSASVPNTLRTLVEEEILENGGHLRIVCCTETLAYGINSNVDVVVVPDMMKQRVDEVPQVSFLRANEYMNYVGRAGRLRRGREAQDQVGYVYPIIRARYLEQGEEMEPQQKAWEELQEEIAHPRRISSRYFTADAEEKPFYLLSLFPNTQQDRRGVELLRLEEVLKSLPAPEGRVYDRERDLLEPLRDLLEKRLIGLAEDVWETDEDDWEEICYRLTDTGEALTGFIIRSDDFERLMEAVRKSVDGEAFSSADLLFAILNGKDMRYEISNSIGSLYKAGTDAMMKMMEGTVNRLWSDRACVSDAMKEQVRELLHVDLSEERLCMETLQLQASDRNTCNLLRVTAALLFWISPYCTVKKMYGHFRIGFPQMQRLAEKVSYYLDIAKFAVSVIRTEDGGTLVGMLGRERTERLQDQIAELSQALYYQISPAMCSRLGCSVTDPASALEARRLTRIYTDLELTEKKIRQGKRLSRKEKKKLEDDKRKIRALNGDQKAVYETFWEVL